MLPRFDFISESYARHRLETSPLHNLPIPPPKKPTKQASEPFREVLNPKQEEISNAISYKSA